MSNGDEDLRQALKGIANTINRLHRHGVIPSACYTALTIINKVNERNITQAADKILSGEHDDDDDGSNFRIGDDEDLL